MAKRSAGLVMYRLHGGALEILCVHLGGPFWMKKDAGAWFIPKGEVESGEDELAAAQREFAEETGFPSAPPFIPLGTIKKKGGKTVIAWAFEGDCDPAALRSNKFSMEWPPKSGKQREFPEVDRAAFFTLEDARETMNAAELEFFVRLAKHMAGAS